MDKPEVDYIEGLSPAISIDQKGVSRNPRSTVGTVTEVYDYLRLLFARVGHPHCYSCGRPVESQTVQQMVDAIIDLPERTRIQILAPMVRRRKGEHKEVFEDARRAGFVRVRVNGETRDLSEDIALQKTKWHDIEVIVDRLVIGGDLEQSRVADSVESALKLTGGDGARERGGRRRPALLGRVRVRPLQHQPRRDGGPARSASTTRTAPASDAPGWATSWRSIPTSLYRTRTSASLRAPSSRGCARALPTPG